ncbi:kinase-like protein [Xylaria arbuscula]|nr:kinase-like protein [Xylaria arbuscula]
MTDIPQNNQDGLEWEFGLFHTLPCWTREPSIAAIENVSRQCLKIPSESACYVSFFAGGTYNKLYRVDYTDGSVLMRVTLPVHPYHKTRGEATTLIWLRYHTSVPVPKVIAFDDSRNNEIGFEWILMELMPGTPAYKTWRTMSMDQKEVMTKRIAEIQAELYYHGKLHLAFKEIGTLHPSTTKEAARMPIPVAPNTLVSMEGFQAYRLKYDVPRGPFRSSYTWLESYINLLILEQLEAIEKLGDDEDKDDPEEILAAARGLLSLLPQVFPETEETNSTPTVLWHHDLNLRNILVDEKGDVTAIVDWECVSAMPIWMTTNIPRFLQGQSRLEEPIRDSYGDETPSDLEWSRQDPDSASDLLQLDNEGKTPLYWEHMMEYEVTKLCEMYKTRLTALWPEVTWHCKLIQMVMDI